MSELKKILFSNYHGISFIMYALILGLSAVSLSNSFYDIIPRTIEVLEVNNIPIFSTTVMIIATFGIILGIGVSVWIFDAFTTLFINKPKNISDVMSYLEEIFFNNSVGFSVILFCITTSFLAIFEKLTGFYVLTLEPTQAHMWLFVFIAFVYMVVLDVRFRLIRKKSGDVDE